MSTQPPFPPSAPWSPQPPQQPQHPQHGAVPQGSPIATAPRPATAAWPPAPPVERPPAYGPPPVPPTGRPAEPRRSSGGGRSAIVAAIVAALVAGTAGGVVGARLADDGSAPAGSSSTAAATTPVSGPVEGSSEEPVAAVAAAVAPAVVQLESDTGLGSGFVYDESGLILTAFHVVQGADQVRVRLADGSLLEGSVLGGDPSTDVAVVKVDPSEDLAVATLATGVDVSVGQLAVAIGSPFGLDQTVTSGIVSAVGRSSETPGGVIPAIQTDAPINSGNSGGALVDRQGRIIGINDSIITGGGDSNGNLGIGFAIPIDIAKAVADRIVAGESTDAAFLGVEGAESTGNRVGAAIASVEPGSPAADAGLQEGDVVVAVDGQRVSSMIDLAAKIRTSQPGDEVTLTVERDGQEAELTVELGTAPAN